MKFSIIHASYGRPKIAMQTIDKWLSNCYNIHDIQYILSIDECDPEYNNYERVVGKVFYDKLGISITNSDAIEAYKKYFRGLLNETNTSVAAINNAAKQATGDIIIVISDDFEPIPNWDLEILKVVEGKKDWILKTHDGTQPWIITLPIMDRSYYERFGYIYNPAYSHMFCDTELTHVADLLGRKLTSSLLFKHNHYSVGGIAKDQTSVKADKTWDSGKKVYLDNLKRKFDLVDVDVMKLPPEAKGHLKWLHTELLGIKW